MAQLKSAAGTQTQHASSSPTPDILIAGAGVVGLSLALELAARGARVTVLERDTALSHASTAAAGMLAVQDPHNPRALLPLSLLSAQLYPSFLARIERLSGIAVPFQTSVTHQYGADGSASRLQEHSVDPRQLAAALLAAVRASPIVLREHMPVTAVASAPSPSTLVAGGEHGICGSQTVVAAGAWSGPLISRPVRPVKGQSLRVQLPGDLDLREVHRSEQVYIVPRTRGPQAGTAVIGATVQDAGFDTVTHPADLTRLRSLAADLLPELADEGSAPQLEAWAGLRPATPDGLPILGRSGSAGEFLAIGHYRNGILLAPATAVVIADLLEGKQPSLDLAAFSPARFG